MFFFFHSENTKMFLQLINLINKLAEFFVLLQVVEQAQPVIMFILAVAKAMEILSTVQGSKCL